ncbi:RsiV family protein [Rhodococcus sp. G-MC3]|uniref:RsiV family protein n=1 Tax=Rhodococcus sp. G-MC3 TaxID=3046209 RepID=UPI0024BB3E7F|nr:RsiV family protein [Rhodococcus sp. G-MC3]MDJ0396073.1 RsiV family protein [Rhodococcus sp. G-MC3]
MRTAIVTAGIVALLAGCSTAGTPTAAPDTAASPTSMALPITSAPSPTTFTSPVGYSFSTVRVAGSTDRVTYDVSIPQIEGPDPAVVGEFNESMHAAFQDQIDGFANARFSLADARPGPTYAGSSVVGAVLNTSWDANPPGAHPTYVIATVTVNTATAEPITLHDVFPDLQVGLQRLSEQSALLLPSTPAGTDFEASGIEPAESNFANWVPSSAGMNIRFSDYQVGPHAIGLIDVTIPWGALADVADPRTLNALSS